MCIRDRCNQCAYVCPHAAIRPFLLTDEEAAGLPEGVETKQAAGSLKEYKFRIQVSPLDCTGCGNCVEVCPTKEKSLVMKPLDQMRPLQSVFEYLHEKVGYKSHLVDKSQNAKNSQFSQPLFEFSGACAGCGETPYVKLMTQLFGDRMMVANATGCSSIYSGSFPSSPYTCNALGQGPAWANSLFEDNAEFGLGMHLGSERMRDRLEQLMTEAQAQDSCPAELKELFSQWIAERKSPAQTAALAEKIVPAAEACGCPACREIVKLKDYLVVRSQWIVGGDGWAYDIGYGGLDHVLASGDDINVLVMDTEVYSNTGGQASKSTPLGAIAQFAAAGKRIGKKDLGRMAMSYGYVYVASIAMGADKQQVLKAFREAEAYKGPSLIIAYAPCINQGIRKGMGKSQEEEKLAVQTGYWPLYRFNPELAKEGKNPFQLDYTKDPNGELQAFLAGETRFAALDKKDPEVSKQLKAELDKAYNERHALYKQLASLPHPGSEN